MTNVNATFNRKIVGATVKTEEMDKISGLESTKSSKEADLTDAIALVTEKQPEIDTVLG